MKKILAILLATVMLLVLVAGCGGATQKVGGTLTVGYGRAATGDFIHGFGNSAYDLSIKTLLHGGASMFVVTLEGHLETNKTTLRSLDEEVDDEGNKTYTITIQRDLKWSDGERITAKDYVAAYLWNASPQWIEAGADSYEGVELIGWEAYNEGETEYFAGIQLIDDWKYSLTVAAEELPNYSEYMYISASPIPLHSYAPEINIVSDENGSKFDGDIADDAMRVATEERFAPTVVCGPYTFVSFENNVVTLKVNLNYKGDSNGKKPTIEYIQQIEVSDATDVDMLFAGDVDYLPEEIVGEKIERVKAEPGFEAHSFLRNGYGVMNMACDWGPTADVNVRWAIACLVDRNALLEQVLEGYGGLVDTEAGEAQWMYQMKKGELQEQLIPIALSVSRANEYLDKTEWKFEADGTTPFDPSKATGGGYFRHNAAGEMLTIVHGAANAQVGAVLEIEFLKNTPLAGINYNFEYPDWDTILDQLYFAFRLPDEERYFSTFSMGTGFGVPFDPYYSWHSDFLGTYINAAQFEDAELDSHIISMRRREPTDHEGYLDAWFKYAIRWNQMLPSIPLYSNEYFDLHSSRVQNVNTNPFASWYAIISEITLAD
ncbi:MAG: ABC transporter substrate-binding protein [Oscillospiraceae bacterium]|nr:ABC transporter substrate-binding protein [Oscillospiraceae bacterium]